MSEKQAERRAQIEAAAFQVLESVGYKKASMLQIAKKAKASNETLYSWYGNKQALFSSLIATNAQVVRDSLQAAVAGLEDPDHALFELGRVLLRFTATEKAVIINRAAVADAQDSGLLAEAIEQNARQVMLEMVETLMTRLEATGAFIFEGGAAEATEVYVSLLIGELQMQQSLGAVPPLTDAQIDARAKQACRLFDRLYRRP